MTQEQTQKYSFFLMGNSVVISQDVGRYQFNSSKKVDVPRMSSDGSFKMVPVDETTRFNRKVIPCSLDDLVMTEDIRKAAGDEAAEDFRRHGFQVGALDDHIDQIFLKKKDDPVKPVKIGIVKSNDRNPFVDPFVDPFGFADIPANSLLSR